MLLPPKALVCACVCECVYVQCLVVPCDSACIAMFAGGLEVEHEKERWVETAHEASEREILSVVPPANTTCFTVVLRGTMTPFSHWGR